MQPAPSNGTDRAEGSPLQHRLLKVHFEVVKFKRYSVGMRLRAEYENGDIRDEMLSLSEGDVIDVAVTWPE